MLYPTAEAIAMAKTVELQVDSTKTDTLTIVLMKFSKRPHEKEQEKITEWLKARVRAKELIRRKLSTIIVNQETWSLLFVGEVK